MALKKPNYENSRFPSNKETNKPKKDKEAKTTSLTLFISHTQKKTLKTNHLSQKAK